ncbi:MAG: hypothetical protein ACRYHQ_34075 [Janthinobacterium lividum]
MMAGSADWEALALPPTNDADAVRRAYRARLKVVGPDRDPDGFQRLRAAYDAVLAELDSARTGTPPAEDADAGASVTRVLKDLDAHRSAGDEAGAIGVIDAALAALPPGSAALDALEDALLDDVALSRTLSAGLFRHLVARFDWHDAQGRTARDDPERHAVLEDRLTAEEWLDALRQEAAGPGGIVAAAMLASRHRKMMPLPPNGFDPDARDRVRTLFGELREHSRFLLHRFDGASLARVREAVEGPPLVVEPAAPASPLASVLPDRAVTQRRGRQIGMAMSALIVGGVFAKDYVHGLLFPPDRGTVPELARAELGSRSIPWLELSAEPGGTLVSWAPLIERRRAIADLRYGANTDEPNAVMNLPENGVPLRFVAPPSLTLMTVRLRFLDGTWSEVRRYEMNGGPGADAAPGGAPRR